MLLVQRWPSPPGQGFAAQSGGEMWGHGDRAVRDGGGGVVVDPDQVELGTVCTAAAGGGVYNCSYNRAQFRAYGRLKMYRGWCESDGVGESAGRASHDGVPLVP